MMTVFADTFYFLALSNSRDASHHRAVQWTNRFRGRILTSAWVLAEFGNSMSSPQNRQEFVAMVGDLRVNSSVAIIDANAHNFDAGFQLYAARSDKQWSFVDCTSFAIMQSEGIVEALTGDHHFEQAGFTLLLK